MPGPQKGVKCPPQLTDDERYLICQWLAQFLPVSTILARIKSQFGKTCSEENIYAYRSSKRWKPLVDRCRQEWAAGLMDLPLAHKRGRLEELTKLYHHVDTIRTTEYTRLHTRLSILEDIRLEMDEKTTNFTSVFLTQITNYSDAELLKRKEELLEKLNRLGAPRRIEVLPAPTNGGSP